MISNHPLHTHLASAPGPRLFVALWGGLAVVDVSRAGQLPASVQIAALTALAAACAVGQCGPTAAAVAAVSWLVVLGFVVNRWGELALRGPGDLMVLGVILATSLGISAATR